MKEIPILFSTPMVQAILAGRKTMTRRVVKSASGRQSEWLTDGLINSVPHGEIVKGGWQMHHPKAGQVHAGVEVAYDSPLGWIKCPYGQPGDVLWVREIWNWVEGFAGSGCYVFKTDERKEINRWRPSIHMPKEAARIWLQVTEVRVERLQVITGEDILSEGVGEKHRSGEKSMTTAGIDYRRWEADQKSKFQKLWESINGADSWNANPWVWVVSFNVLSTTGKPDLKTK